VGGGAGCRLLGDREFHLLEAVLLKQADLPDGSLWGEMFCDGVVRTKGSHPEVASGMKVVTVPLGNIPTLDFGVPRWHAGPIFDCRAVVHVGNVILHFDGVTEGIHHISNLNRLLNIGNGGTAGQGAGDDGGAEGGGGGARGLDGSRGAGVSGGAVATAILNDDDRSVLLDFNLGGFDDGHLRGAGREGERQNGYDT